ncbi:DUF3046 domain-containing protein [Leucobacter sp. OH1287]|uniref:DUF3046 domain-containing protein n=1 Tax=Leucobacter sp. OH1287 TaxID=2491049 RepID=UPI000F5FB99C|nr:DUF3046 domain-containing protein [Leucobacter sp. OH1287]RRD61777.1 DUF3046 domain-containing protein [Leucobacter sp. OH1287]
MKHSEFNRAVAEQFGERYATVLLRDHWLVRFSATPAEALASGADPCEVWLALCDDFDVPAADRYGRGLLNPER